LSTTAINHSFEAEKNRKALMYTSGVIGLFLMIAIFYTWPLQIPPVPTVQDLIDVNLGNEQEGMGNIQPLVKGERAPDNQSIQSHEKASKAAETPSQEIKADENNDDKDAAPVAKVEKPKDDAKDINKNTVAKKTKNINPSPIVNPNPAPRKPKLPLYKGGNGNGGNGATQDNGYRNQGYKAGNGDAGSPDGKADAYGDSPGGRSGGGMSIVSGDRRILRAYSFKDELDRAIVYATIRVSPDGLGTFLGFARNSSTMNPKYAESISNHLRQVQFNKADHESTITVEIKFDVD
jgi:hypothetical protein